MTSGGPPWLPIVVSALRDVSADLLDPGISQSAPLGATGGHGPLLRALLSAADSFVHLVPTLLAELDEADTDLGEWRAVRVPHRAKPSTAIYDYAQVDGVRLPMRWLRFDPDVRRDEGALRWALNVASQLHDNLKSHAARLETRLEEALLVRAGDSEWALDDAQTLHGLGDGLQRRIVAVDLAQRDIRGAAARPIAPSVRPPSPFPRQPGWTRLRRLARDLLQPESLLGMVLNQVLTEPIPLADVPFLYQRWCGLQLVKSFERCGWSVRGELIGPLFLGGRIAFTRGGGAALVLWVEPRVCEATMSMTGWSARGGRELTPDFLISCGATGWRDAFVLDATLSRSDEVVATKSKYRLGMLGTDTQLIAGVPVPRTPLRSWAIAPWTGSSCRLGDPEGRSGGIPLNPGDLDLGPLDSWVGDLSIHAQRLLIRDEVAV